VGNLEGILSAGTYFARVNLEVSLFAGVFVDTPYHLRLTGIPTQEAILPDGAGETLINARDLGILTDELVFNDSLLLDDPADIYRFSITQPRNISAVVLGLKPDAATTIELLRDDNSNGAIDPGEIRHSGAIIGAGGASVSIPAGTYFLSLKRDRSETPYSLTLSPTPSSLLPPDTRANAY